MSSDRPRILHLGKGPTAASALESLADRFDVLGIVRDAGPGDDAVEVAARCGVPVIRDLSPGAVAELVESRDPDCVVVSSYDRILPAALVASRPFVNVHYAPLPRYRGRATVNWAVLNGEPTCAVTVHVLAPELDAGGVLCQEFVAVEGRDTVGDLYRKLNAVQRRVLAGAVERRLAGDLGVPQDESQATYGCTRIPDDGEIDWNASTDRVDRLVRALGPPYPAAFTFLRLRRLEIIEGSPAPAAPRYEGRVPGRVAARSRVEGWVDVLTRDGVYRLSQVRPEGGEVVAAATVLTSLGDTLGLRGIDLLSRIASLESRLAGQAMRDEGEATLR